MMTKSIVSVFALTAIALGIVPLGDRALANSPDPDKKITFLCNLNSEIPTTDVRIESAGGQVNQKKYISWYPQYATDERSSEELCQQVTQKLQSHYENGSMNYLSDTKLENGYAVCFVPTEEADCTAESEVLFTVSKNHEARCALTHENPVLYCSSPRAIVSKPRGSYERTIFGFRFW